MGVPRRCAAAQREEREALGQRRAALLAEAPQHWIGCKCSTERLRAGGRQGAVLKERSRLAGARKSLESLQRHTTGVDVVLAADCGFFY